MTIAITPFATAAILATQPARWASFLIAHSKKNAPPVLPNRQVRTANREGTEVKGSSFVEVKRVFREGTDRGAGRAN